LEGEQWKNANGEANMSKLTLAVMLYSKPKITPEQFEA
jgi:hypothetical protein